MNINLPELAEGEIYVGCIGDAAGNLHHVILLPGDNDDDTHEAQLEWAKSIGGDLPTRIEQAMLWANHREQFKKDWPEHAAREERLKRELEALKTTFTETLEALQGQISPLAQTVQMTAQERHLQTITTAHPDALDIVPKVEEWIGTQPKIYQGEMKRIIEGGTAAEVVELLNLYKGATAPPEQPAKAKTDPAKEARLKRMESPTTARTAVTAEADPDDFDSAFEAEAKKYKMQ